jgi:hypothetical protein
VKVVLCVVLILLLAAAPAAVQAQFDYTTNADGVTLTITGYSGPPWAVVIPININGLRVVNIGNGVFYWNTNITSLTIPGSVTNIGYNAFQICTSLTNVTIPDSVVSIGSDAFGGAGLTSVSIPASVTNLGEFAFFCPSLTAITVDSQNAFYSSVGGVVFDKSGFTLVEYPHGGVGSYTIPAGVTNIGYGAFFGCVGLTSVTIPGSVISIEGAAFGYCFGLKDVAISNGLCNLLGNAFPDCTNLSRITIPGSVTNIGPGAFENCTSLINVTIPDSVVSLGDSAFVLCSNLAGVFFAGNPPAIGSNVFNYDTNVTAYYLPGAIGWSNTFAGVPALLWNPVIQTGDFGFGVRNNQFGFDVTGTTNIPIVVEACTALASSGWIPLQTLKLTNGSFHYSEPFQANSSGRFYRISSP